MSRSSQLRRSSGSPQSRRLRATPALALLACAAAVWIAQTSAAADPPLTVDEADAARLRALGYVEFSTAKDEDPSRHGVTHFDPERAAPGLNLVISARACVARLMDMQGRELHRWTQVRCKHWWGAALMRNGDLLVNGSLIAPPPPRPGSPSPPAQSGHSKRFAARIAWTGEAVWILRMRSHHQLDLSPNGELVVLTESTLGGQRELDARQRIGEKAGELPLHDNSVKWMDVDGKVHDVLSLMDAIGSNEDDFPFADLESLREGSKHIGLFHCNSAFAMNQPHLAGSDALHSEHNVLVTSRNQDRIFVVSRETRSLVWQWGRDELQAPHYATWLANGNILVLDNGIERERSRVLEIDPTNGQIVWQYGAGEGHQRFFTKTRGAAQRLDNGNTLIVVANPGKAIEVTPEGDIVWEYYLPVFEKKRPVIITLQRYPESWIEAKAADAAETP